MTVRRILVSGATVLAAACAAAEPAPSMASCGPSAAPRVVAFNEFGTIAASWPLPEGGPAGVLGVSALAVSPEGELLVADGRQRRLLRFSPGFKAGRPIGAQGEGPGEYRMPRYPAFGPAGEMLVLDIDLARVVRYDSTGKFVQTVRAPTADARAIDVIADGDLLVAGNRASDGRDRLLTRIDATGKVRWSAVPTDTILRATQLIVGGAWLVPKGEEEVLVGLSVAPTIFRVRIADGAVICRSAVPAGTWRQLSPADRPNGGTLAAMRTWIERATTIVGATRLDDGQVLLTLASGSGDAAGFEWVLFDSALTPVTRVPHAPGRAIASAPDGFLIVTERDDGTTVVEQIRLSPRAR